jgi:hypothetical protein
MLFALMLIVASEPIVPEVTSPSKELSIAKSASLWVVRLPARLKMIWAIPLMLPPLLLIPESRLPPIERVAAATSIAAFPSMLPVGVPAPFWPFKMWKKASVATSMLDVTTLTVALPPMCPPPSFAIISLK